MGGGKGGQKRGRTQRRHFRQSRDNTWKYGNKKTRADEDSTIEDANADPNPNPSWEPFSTKNLGFEEYYKKPDARLLKFWQSATLEGDA